MLVVIGNKNSNKKKSKNKQKSHGKAMVTIGAIAVTVCAIRNENEATTQNNINTPVTIEDVKQTIVERNPVEIDVDDLLSDYCEATTVQEVKEVNAEYSDKYIKLSGDINKIYHDPFEGNYITLRGDEIKYDTWMSVQCKFADKEEIEKLNELQKGDEVTIQGYCIGGSGMSVKLEDCIIKER